MLRHLLPSLVVLATLPCFALDDVACKALAAALGDKDAAVRKSAADKLWGAEACAAANRAQLLEALDDPDANVVAYAAGALQSIGMKDADLAPARKRVLDAPEASVSSRFFAARNLVGYEAPLKLVDPMIAYLERNAQGYTGSAADKNRHNVEIAQKALARLVDTQDRPIVAPLMQALHDTRGGNIPLLKALGRFEPKPEGWTSALLAQLDHSNPRVRYEALGQLRHVTQEEEIARWAPRAAQMLGDSDASVRSNALWALGSARGLAAGQVDAVAAATSDPDPSVRRAGVRALGEIADANQAIPAAARTRVAAAARPAIEKAMQDEDGDVRSEAKSALRNVDAGGGAATAASIASEEGGLAYLRSHKVKFDDHSWYLALSKLDVARVQAFLDAGMSPSASVSGMGPPIRVMLSGSEACSPNERPTKPEAKAIARLLLERGTDIKAADGNGNTAISEAASKGCDRETIRMLIKAGANIEATNISGLTPFEMGLWSGHDGLEELIAAGYRLPPQKVKMYLEAYKARPAAVAMVKKAARK